jgi:hypothetical protein
MLEAEDAHALAESLRTKFAMPRAIPRHGPLAAHAIAEKPAGRSRRSRTR